MTTNDPMMTYPIGRFSIAVPQSMKKAARTASLRFTELREVPWQKEPGADQQREAIWKRRLGEIENLKPPSGKEKVIIEMRSLPFSAWVKNVLYSDDQHTARTMFWETLVDAGKVGLWLTQDGLDKNLMEENGLDIARSYHPLDPATPLPKENGFYLEHGYITLPYLEQEETYARFEGRPLELKLEIAM